MMDSAEEKSDSDSSLGIPEWRDELAEYLALDDIKASKKEHDVADWWRSNSAKFPNLEVMARQYLGCPATSATVERLFSAVGHAYDDKRQSADAGTLQSLMFSKANVPSRPNGKKRNN